MCCNFSGLLAGDVKESRNGNPTRDLQMAADRTRPHSAAMLADMVGSRTGAALRRFSLAVAPRFLWECLISRTVSWFPAPAASNPSCRFPAMGLPVCFTVKGYETAFAGWAFGDDHGRRSR